MRVAGVRGVAALLRRRSGRSLPPCPGHLWGSLERRAVAPWRCSLVLVPGVSGLHPLVESGWAEAPLPSTVSRQGGARGAVPEARRSRCRPAVPGACDLAGRGSHPAFPGSTVGRARTSGRGGRDALNTSATPMLVSRRAGPRGPASLRRGATVWFTPSSNTSTAALSGTACGPRLRVVSSMPRRPLRSCSGRVGARSQARHSVAHTPCIGAPHVPSTTSLLPRSAPPRDGGGLRCWHEGCACGERHWIRRER